MFIVEEIACRGATRIQFSIAFGHYKEFFKCVQHDRKKKKNRWTAETNRSPRTAEYLNSSHLSTVLQLL